MSTVLAIDPGPAESAYVLYDAAERRVRDWNKLPNGDLLYHLDGINGYGSNGDALAIEMVASYGMAVGAEIFETCVWIGRFVERWQGAAPRLVYRREVKLHLCHDSRAKDPNIRQALIDRFGGKDAAIGKKAAPGPLYGLAGDGWAALGVAVTAAETDA